MHPDPLDESSGAGASEERLDALFLQVIEGSETAWPRQLEEQCRRHPDDAAALRERYAALVREGLASSPAVEQVRCGEALGPYLLERRLGNGGMATVFAASREGERFALKILRADQRESARARERFAREGRIARELHDRHLCPVLEVGEANGVAYLVMPLVEGETLHERLRREPDSLCGTPAAIRRTALLFAKIADALTLLHVRGLVHRDVKPANLILDREGEPVLVDFGLAREEGSPRLTQTGVPIGTPVYMAPEQLRGSASAGAAADLYSLGVSLYECLCLRPPFLAADRETLYRSILSDDPPDARRRNGQIPRALWAVLSCCLEKDPRRRYARAAELAAELRAFASGAPVRARLPGVARRAAKWVRRHPLASAVLLCAALITASALLLVAHLRELERSSALLAAIASRGVAEENPVVCALLAAEAWRRHPSFETRSLLLSASAQLAQIGEVETEVLLGWARPSPDGRVLALGCSWPESLRLRNHGPWEEVLPGAGHSGAWSPDGRRVAVLSFWGRLQIFSRARSAENVEVEIWRSERGADDVASREEHIARNSLYSAMALVHWLDDEQVLVGDKYGSLRRYDARGMALGSPLELEESPICGIFGLDGARGALVVCRNGRIARLDATGAVAASITIEGVASEVDVRLVEASTNGRWACLRLRDGSFYRLRLDGSLAPERIGELAAAVAALAIGNSGELVVAATDDRFLHYWRKGTWTPLRDDAATSLVGRLAIDAGETMVAAGDNGGRIRILDAELRELRLLRGHRTAISDLGFEAAGAKLRSASHDGTVRLWRLEDEVFPVLWNGARPVFAADWLADGERVVGIDYEGRLPLWSASGDGLASARMPRGRSGIALARDRRHFACYSSSKPALEGEARLRCFELRTAEGEPQEIALSQEIGPVLWAAYLPDGRLVARGEEDRYLVERDGEVTPLASSARGRGGLVVASPVEALLASAHNARPLVFLWSPLEDAPAREIEVGEVVSALEFRPDGKVLAIGTRTGAVRLFDLASGSFVAEFLRHESEVKALAWTPDQLRIISAAADGRAWIRSADDPTPIAELLHPGSIHDVAVHPDGTRFLTAGSDGTVRLWPLAIDDLEWLASRIFRKLSAREQRGFEPLLR